MISLVDWASDVFGRFGVWGLSVVSFAESSFFPIPPDVLLIPMVLAAPPRGLFYASLTTAASVLGALFGYVLGVRGGRPLLVRLTGGKGIDQVQTYFQEYGGWAVGIAAFTPIPYKVFTIASGIFRVRVTPFLIASIVGRGARFFLEAALVMKFGDSALDLLGSRFERITFALTATVIVVALLAGWLRRSRDIRRIRRSRTAHTFTSTATASPGAATYPGTSTSSSASTSTSRRTASSPLATLLKQLAAWAPPGSRQRRTVEALLWLLAAVAVITILAGELANMLYTR